MIRCMSDRESNMDYRNEKKFAPRKVDIRSTVRDFTPNNVKNVTPSYSVLENKLNRLL